MLRHFVMKYDPDYVTLGKIKPMCDRIFGYHKCLVVAEKIECNAHVHFQGLTDLTEDSFKEYVRQGTADHYLRVQASKKKGIVQHSAREVTDLGFQYMCKEHKAVQHVLHSNGFTTDDIAALHAASISYIKDKKAGLMDALSHVPRSNIMKQNVHWHHKQLVKAAYTYYKKEVKMWPPNFAKIVLWSWAKHPEITSVEEEYIMDKIGGI